MIFTLAVATITSAVVYNVCTGTSVKTSRVFSCFNYPSLCPHMSTHFYHTSIPCCMWNCASMSAVQRAPAYLMECCTLISDISCWQYLQSISYHRLFIPRHRCSMLGQLIGLLSSWPSLADWNSLPDTLCNPTRLHDSFWCDLKSLFLSVYYCIQHIWLLAIMCYINLPLTVTLTLCHVADVHFAQFRIQHIKPRLPLFIQRSNETVLVVKMSAVRKNIGC